MIQADGLLLRDIHQPPPPPWWPLAPGWWVVAALLALGVVILAWRGWRRHQRRRAIERLFDDAVAAAPTPAGRVAAISELLRRAARRLHPDADTLAPDAWLRVLDAGATGPRFDDALGELLHDGAFRREVAAQDAERLRQAARVRFVGWMTARR